ncbi:MAG: DUF1934 domain-containing protein [Oscillospiraceae bacterium]|jgi:uncharacterized beta-barrel protein YwiB (DUF1934 family)|nr:DUF1934 domain-containing protein [Oscillospiraceae bacterium]
MLNKKVLLDIQMSMVNANDIEDYDMSVIGNYRKKDNNYIVEYLENAMDNTKTVITFGEQVEILRQGCYNSNILMELNKRCQSIYSTPFGEANVSVTASHIDCNLNDFGGDVKLKYAIDIDGQLSSAYSMSIKIKEMSKEGNK